MVLVVFRELNLEYKNELGNLRKGIISGSASFTFFGEVGNEVMELHLKASSNNVVLFEKKIATFDTKPQIIPINEAFIVTDSLPANVTVRARILFPAENRLMHTETKNLNYTGELQKDVVTIQDVAVSITNASYIQDSTGQRAFIFDTPFSIVNQSNVPVGTKIDVILSFVNEAGQFTGLLTILKTLSTVNGIFHFEIRDSTILVDNSMIVRATFTLRGLPLDQISTQFSKGLVLVVEEPPTPILRTSGGFITFQSHPDRIDFIILDSDVPLIQSLLSVNNAVMTITSFATEAIATHTFAQLRDQIVAIAGQPIQCPTGQHEENGICVPDIIVPIINTIFRVTITDTTFDRTYIISQEDTPIIDMHTFDPRVILQNVGDGTTTSPVTHTGSAVIVEIDTFLASNPPPPPEPDSNSYTMELKVGEYKATPEGKSIFLQVEVTRIGIAINSAVSSLTIKNSANQPLAVHQQSLQIGGADVFPIVFDIPDTEGLTAKIFFEIVLHKSLTDFTALTQFPLTGSLVFEAPPVVPTPTSKGSILSKALGFAATLGTLTLLAGKGR